MESPDPRFRDGAVPGDGIEDELVGLELSFEQLPDSSPPLFDRLLPGQALEGHCHREPAVHGIEPLDSPRIQSGGPHRDLDGGLQGLGSRGLPLLLQVGGEAIPEIDIRGSQLSPS